MLPPPLRRAARTTSTAAGDTECFFAIRSTRSPSVSDISCFLFSSSMAAGAFRRTSTPLWWPSLRRTTDDVGRRGWLDWRGPAGSADPADHSLDGVAEEPACRGVIAEFARPLQVFPGDLEGVLKQLGQ
jgi:hypothetical protein